MDLAWPSINPPQPSSTRLKSAHTFVSAPRSHTGPVSFVTQCLGAPMARKREFVYTHRSVRKQGLRDGRDWRWKFWPPKWPFREEKEAQPSGPQADHAQFEVALKEAAE